MSHIVRDRLARWKQNLLDLTFRNPFLNYRYRDTSAIQIVDEAPAELFRLLQLEGEALTFLPWNKEVLGKEIPPVQDYRDFDSQELSPQHVDKTLQTAMTDEKLNKVLSKMMKEAQSWLDEKGINTLHLALGMLEYRDPASYDATRFYKAPILLLPVQLKREDVKKGIQLSITDGDPILNPALAKKLQWEFHIELPALQERDEEFCPRAFFREVQEAVAKQKDWRITTECYLAFFSFQKFAMYKDMEDNEGLYLEHPVIQSLCDPRTNPAPQFPAALSEANLDEVMPPERSFLILDADSSQQQAILKVRQGQSLIIEGPPGTGKSQSITNLIADALASGKRVLFVSEKKAALEVVYQRLQAKGLHDFCLELHGNKVSKRVVLDELKRVLDKTQAVTPEDGQQFERRLPVLRQELSDYIQALHQPAGKLNRSVYKVIWQLQSLAKVAPVLVSLPDVSAWSEADLESLTGLLNQHAMVLSHVGRVSEHPWLGCQLQQLSSMEQELLRQTLLQTHEKVDELIRSVQTFADLIGAAIPKRLGEVEVLCEVASTLCQSPHTSEAILQNPVWDAMPPQAKQLLEQGKRYTHLCAQARLRFKEALLSEPLADFEARLDRFKEKRASALWWLTSFPFDAQFRQDKLYFKSFQEPNYNPSDIQTFFNHLEEVREANRLREALKQQSDDAQTLFGEHWKGLDSNWQKLSDFAAWIVKVRGFAIGEYLNEKGIELAATGSLNENEQIGSSIKNLRELTLKCHSLLAEVMQRGQMSEALCGFSASPKTDLEATLEKIAQLIENFTLLANWMDYQRLHAICKETPQISGFVAEYEGSDSPPEQMSETFLSLFYRQWLDWAIAQNKSLQHFRSHLHEEKRKEFKDLDKRVLEYTRKALLSQLHQASRQQLNQVSSEELTLLQGQIRSARGRKTLRQLLRYSGRALQALKPCLMMSPLSVAEMIDPQEIQFDLVIFDEASQVTPEEALGCIARGKQTVVVGDPKQLPPTNFFSKQVMEDEQQQAGTDGEEWLPDDEESILDQFGSAGFHSHGLKWHYRSRHESLIAFSNAKFYKNLYTFPSADSEHPLRGLQFELVNGVYQGGGKNMQEAHRVVDAIWEHIRQNSELSLGVGTFGVAQKDIIEDLIEERRRQDPSADFFFNPSKEEPFFVKNLENIQGDERDVIFLSVTYGPDALGRVKNQFGPLLGKNGWRRLNVVITRAKLMLKVFSSMRGDQIDLTKTDSYGARLLRDYLLYAERKILELPEFDGHGETDSPFEDAVYDALSQRGLRLVKQVGQSGYRIDFGVLDHEIEGLFIAGIECDGATYHSSASARDRDRLRQEVLEGLGWKIYRIWSTDWYKNPDEQADRIVELVKAGRAEVLESRTQQVLNPPPVWDTEIPDPAEELTPQDKALLRGDLPPIETYRLTPISLKGTAETFGKLAQPVYDVMMAVLAQEAPLHSDELFKRVAAHWGIQRVTSRIESQMLGYLTQLTRNKLILLDDGFVRLPETKIVPRDRVRAGLTPKAEYIAIQEYQAAIHYILSYRGAMMLDDLQKEVARMMGFARSGNKVQERLSTAIRQLLEVGSLSHVASGVQWNETASVTDI